MVENWLDVLLTLTIGIAAGTFYFGGLWWTVKKLPDTRRPAWLSLASFLLRAVVVLTIFYVATQGQWDRLLLCLVGFSLARLVLLRRIGLRTDKSKWPNRFGKDASIQPKG